ncbi:MAG: peptide ABC transporter substrate-binding protein [Chloroflexota bacterium]|nr:peptide ABC transporter substrate-binding protein [Chloroflexota bacterium]
MRRLTSRGRLPRLVAGFAAILLAFTSSLPAHPAAAAGPVLRYVRGEPATLDPAFIDSAGDVQFLLQLYAGLTRLDEEGRPYASLAESWSLSADGRTYTFQLRSGLTFSDGSPLEATDVRRSWLRILDPATQSTAPDVLSIIRGAGERLAGGPEDGVAIEAPDARRLVVSLNHPAAYFTAMIATPTAFVVPRGAGGSNDSWQSTDSFIGSGPYVADGTDGTDLILRANERYVAGPPPIAEIRWITDLPGDSVTAFADDQVDLTGVGSNDAAWITYDRDLGSALHRSASLGVQYFGFDTTQPPFDDARVRRAFALALDRPRLVANAEGSSGTPASSLVPPALWPDGLEDDQETDRRVANRLLDEAGYRDRSLLGTITVNGSGLGVSPAVTTWEEVLGVTMAVETMEFRDYLRALVIDPPQVFTINWIADYPSPYALYSLLLLPDATSNYGHWDDPEFVRLLEAASAATTQAEQATAYRAVDAWVDAEAPVIPWAYGAGWWLVRPGLRGLGNLTTGLLDLGRVSWAE